MSKINEYLPKVLQPIEEYKTTNEDLDIELDRLNSQIDSILKEVIANTATEYGISRWENTLGLTHSESDSLELRRFRITNILTNKLPYTYRWLRNKLIEITGDSSGWALNIDNDNYTIVVTLTHMDLDMMAEVQKNLRYAIPANMVLEMGSDEPIPSDLIRVGTAMVVATKWFITGYVDIDFKTYGQVRDGYSYNQLKQLAYNDLRTVN
ncbi:MAG: DUF2313 domain-containing protein [Romboutsia sp.]|nr:DUF2313 domain-containing protein [Romboutsia sp.]